MACREANVPVVMRCPNYRLFCPNGLHLAHGEICERCLRGKEYWCVLRNCEGDRLKSLGYALRNAAARITQGIVANVGVFVVLSQFQRRRFIDGGIPEHRVEVLPNVIPTVSEGTSTDLGDLIAFVGRVSPEKGIYDFLEVARRLEDLPFVVAGATDRFPEIVQKASPNVLWLGHLKEDKLNEIYRRLRILVCPFRWFEGFPNVITRAMAFGKPAIASRIGAIPEIVEHEHTGLLCETGNTNELTSQIKMLYAEPARCRQLGEAGRLKAKAAYSPEVVYRRLMAIYAKALIHAV
jgi:glycosyltransferase involved in cell wall biosynthesis